MIALIGTYKFTKEGLPVLCRLYLIVKIGQQMFAIFNPRISDCID